MSQIRPFTIDGHRVDDVLSFLQADGFEIEQPVRVTRTVLDTFDGRLHQAGARLELRRTSHLELVLGQRDRALPVGWTDASTRVRAAPRFASDLAPGPLRLRLAELADVRAMQPVVEFAETTVRAARRDPLGSPVTSVQLHHHVVVEPAGRTIPAPAIIEVTRHVGHDRAFARTCRLLGSVDLPPADRGLVEVVYGLAGVDPSGVVTSATVPLHPDQPAELGFRAVLVNLAHTMQLNWAGTVDDIDTEFLHELRVAVRRTRSVLTHAEGVLPETGRQRFADDFRWLAGLTSTPRDLDVLLLNWPGYVAELPVGSAAVLQTVHERLGDQRRGAHQMLVVAARSQKGQALIPAWMQWLAARVVGSEGGATMPLGAVAAAGVRSEHDRLVHHGRRIDDDAPPEALHDLRKDAKRLRYGVECFAGLFPERATTRYVRRLKQLQDNLGEYQDVAIHREAISAAAGEEEAGEVAAEPAFEQLISSLDRRRVVARGAFAGHFAGFDHRQTTHDLDAMTERLLG